jgi:putative inorganic carbon (HCO3(-)) transporter
MLRTSNTWRIGLIVLAIMASLVAGSSGLVYASPFYPLVVGGAVAAVAIGMAWLRKPVWALYAAMFVVLLPEEFIPARINSILNRSMLLIALGVWLFNVITRRCRIVWTSTALLMLGFLIWGMVTLSWAPNLRVGMESLAKYTLRLILYLLLVANEINTKETLDGLMRILALNAWVLVLAGVGTVLSEGYEPGTRLQVLGMNENLFGISILVTLSGVLWQAMQASEQQKALRMSQSFVFILLALGLVALSGSRGSAISLLTTLLVFWLWKPTRPWGKRGLLILALAAVSAPFIFSTTLERFAGRQVGTPLGGREALWQAAWLLIRDHLWRGVGIGNASYVMMPYLIGIWGDERASIHNPVLQVWAETGIPGLLLYLGVLGSAVWLFVRQCRQRRGTGVRSLASYFALVSSVFVGFMPSWIKGGGMETQFTYFLLLALLLIPSRLDIEGLERNMESDVQDTGRGKP